MRPVAAVGCYAAAPELTVRGWPGEDSVAVFTATTGRTHLVSLLAATILEETSTGPRPLNDLAVAMFDAGSSGETSAPDVESLAVLLAAAEGLVQAGLLIRTECPSPSAHSGPSAPHLC